MSDVAESKQVILMVMPDGRTWVDCLSLVEYLRRSSDSALVKQNEAIEERNPEYAIGCAAVSDAMRQIADSMTLTMMEAGEALVERRRR